MEEVYLMREGGRIMENGELKNGGRPDRRKKEGRKSNNNLLTFPLL